MISENLQLAIDSLEIQDIYIRSSNFEGPRDFISFNPPALEDLTIQNLSWVRAEEVEVSFKNEIEPSHETIKVLKIFSNLGIRWVKEEESEGEKPFVIAAIIAEWVAEYRMKNDLDPVAIEEFAERNSKLHIWPYWREYVSSTCERMRLPKFTLPMYQLLHHRNQISSEDNDQKET